jgi:hypothetical protein
VTGGVADEGHQLGEGWQGWLDRLRRWRVGSAWLVHFLPVPTATVFLMLWLLLLVVVRVLALHQRVRATPRFPCRIRATTTPPPRPHPARSRPSHDRGLIGVEVQPSAVGHRQRLLQRPFATTASAQRQKEVLLTSAATSGGGTRRQQLRSRNFDRVPAATLTACRPPLQGRFDDWTRATLVRERWNVCHHLAQPRQPTHVAGPRHQTKHCQHQRRHDLGLMKALPRQTKWALVTQPELVVPAGPHVPIVADQDQERC